MNEEKDMNMDMNDERAAEIRALLEEMKKKDPKEWTVEEQTMFGAELAKLLLLGGVVIEGVDLAAEIANALNNLPDGVLPN